MKVLIVEDEVRLGQTLEKGFRSEGFVVDRAEDGIRGLDLALGCHHDVIVLDVMLPGLDGFEVLARIRKERCPVPIILLTARTGLDDRVRGLDLGADDYLAKPFEYRELLARIRALTRRPTAAPEMVLRIADLELDLSTHELQRAGKFVPLRNREFTLLEFLMRRKDLVVSRSMILDHAWASDADYGDGANLVDVYIGQLRKKIDQGREKKLLHTLRGAGYLLKEPS